MSETYIRFGKHGARVMIEENEIEHYAIHVDSAKKEVSCWIASEVNKVFSVEWLELEDDYPTAGRLYLDGHSSESAVRRSPKPKIFRYGNVSESSCAPYLFSPLVVTDDDAYLDVPSSQSIGEIKLVILRTTVHKKIPKKPKPSHSFVAPPHIQKVHERSKKAMAHRVGYGIPKAKSEINYVYSTKNLETLVTFIFKYRPLEMLRANDIVPRSPEPLQVEPQTSSRKGKHSKLKKGIESGSEIDDEDNLSMREKALLAEVQRCQAEVEKIRKARESQSKDSSERPKKKLKKEDSYKPLFIPGEIIDLT